MHVDVQRARRKARLRKEVRQTVESGVTRPEIQLGSKGTTISIIDSVISAVLLAAVLGAVQWVIGHDF